MVVTCRRCFREIPSEEIDPSLGFVDCRRCNAIFELRPDGAPPPPRPEVPMPRGVRVRRHAGGEGDLPDPYRGGITNQGSLEIALPFTRWRGLVVVLPALFIIGVGILLGIAAEGGKGKVFALTIVELTGLGLLYPGLAFLANYRTLVIDAEAIDVRIGPVPWPGRRRIAAEAIKQLYVEKVVYRGNRGSDERFVLRTIDEDGIHNTLIVFDRAAQALWLEQEIERQLGIADVPVLPKPD